MPHPVILLSIPGLRAQDLAHAPRLQALASGGDQTTIIPSFPCVTWSVETAMLTGKSPRETGVIGNGFYWREKNEVEMWTAWNDKILAPQIWDVLHEQSPARSSAVWFPMLSKGSGADTICMPAPIHNPDGSESLWCYTKPVELYGTLRDTFGHFPLQHFWGPMANIKSSQWIAESAAYAAKEFKPDFFFIYLPQLDYAAQKHGPDSPQATQAVVELDALLDKLFDEVNAHYGGANGGAAPLWLVASEYVIEAVDHVTYPNRVLREAGLLQVIDRGQGEEIDFANSAAWALADHQFSHVFVRNAETDVIAQVQKLFAGREGIVEVLAGNERAKYNIDHERAGEVILISTRNSWQAYYYWLDDAKAPTFARTVDIHRKPGYDPVELHIDMATKSIPLDAALVRGSHGAPAIAAAQHGALIASRPGTFGGKTLRDTEIAALVLSSFPGSSLGTH